MVINDIEVVNTFLSTPEDEVIIEVDHVDSFEFDVDARLQADADHDPEHDHVAEGSRPTSRSPAW